jgi:hypothetical protein
VGALVIKKKRHLFLMADLSPRAGSPLLFTQTEEANPHAGVERETTSNFASLFTHAFCQLDHARHNHVSLVKLREAIPFDRAAFDAGLQELRRSGQYFLQAAEGRHGLSDAERAAGLEEHGQLLLYVSRRE